MSEQKIHIASKEELNIAVSSILDNVETSSNPPTAKEMKSIIIKQNPLWRFPERRIAKYRKRQLKARKIYSNTAGDDSSILSDTSVATTSSLTSIKFRASRKLRKMKSALIKSSPGKAKVNKKQATGKELDSLIDVERRIPLGDTKTTTLPDSFYYPDNHELGRVSNCDDNTTVLKDNDERSKSPSPPQSAQSLSTDNELYQEMDSETVIQTRTIPGSNSSGSNTTNKPKFDVSVTVSKFDNEEPKDHSHPDKTISLPKDDDLYKDDNDGKEKWECAENCIIS